MNKEATPAPTEPQNTDKHRGGSTCGNSFRTNDHAEIFPDLYEASVEDLQLGMEAGYFTSVDLVKAYFARIDEVNLQGPTLRAVLETSPSALSQAAALDEERKTKGKRGLLHGIPVLLKDNIATVISEGMNTTAGSFSLLGSIVQDDAGVVKRLRTAGVVILGKANMSEWAWFRGNLPSGWSGRGSQCTSAYFPNTNPGGSSSGSGVAASIGLAAVTLGTETGGSITSPSSNNNIVGIKPTVGLTSRAGVIPLSANQDTVGPMTRSITDGAILLSMISGKDPNDTRTMSQPDQVPDYTKALNKDALQGKRIGVPRRVFLESGIFDISDEDLAWVNKEFEQALDIIRSLGAIVVDPADMPSADEIPKTTATETLVFCTDFKVEINRWFEALLENPSGVRSLAGLIQFNKDKPQLENFPHFDQSRLVAAEATDGFNASYAEALAMNRDIGATRGIDAALQQYNLDALVLPAAGKYTSRPAALAGYPIVTVPLGFFPDNTTIGQPPEEFSENPVYPAPGAPFGLSFMGTAFSEFNLIGFGYAYEQATQTRLARRAFLGAIPKTQLKDIVSG